MYCIAFSFRSIENAVGSSSAFLQFLKQRHRVFLFFTAFCFLFGYLYYISHQIGLVSIPGPTLASHSNSWMIRSIFSGQAPMKYRKLHRTDGKFVRTGPGYVVISDPAIIPVIMEFLINSTRFVFFLQVQRRHGRR